jgi:hypothetical protein
VENCVGGLIEHADGTIAGCNEDEERKASMSTAALTGEPFDALQNVQGTSVERVEVAVV